MVCNRGQYKNFIYSASGGNMKMMKEIAMRVIDEEKVDAVVLGCTELPLIFPGWE